MIAGFPKLHALHVVFGLDCPYTNAERAVAAVLILDRNDRLGCAYRGQAGIAKRAGVSRRAAQRALASLIGRSDGPLIVSAERQGRTSGVGGRAPNRYYVQLRDQATHKPGKQQRQADAQASQSGEREAKPERLERRYGRGFAPKRGGSSARLTQDLSKDLSIDRGIDRSSSAHPRGPVFNSSTLITDELLDDFETDTFLASKAKSAAGCFPKSYEQKWQSDPKFFERINRASFARENRNHGRKPPGAIEREGRERRTGGERG